MVDRRMINNFLVSYADPKAEDKVKTHMLDAMSKILGFSMEEKQKLEGVTLIYNKYWKQAAIDAMRKH